MLAAAGWLDGVDGPACTAEDERGMSGEPMDWPRTLVIAVLVFPLKGAYHAQHSTLLRVLQR